MAGPSRHPLRGFARTVTLVLVLVAVALGVAPYSTSWTGSSWWGIGIALVIGLVIWGAVARRLTAVAQEIGTAFATQPFRGIGIGIVLTMFYAIVIATVFLLLLPILQQELAAEWRTAWVITTVVALLAMVPFVRMYRATGIPIDPANLSRGAWALAFIVVGVFGYVTYRQPDRFFDPNSGAPQFMVAPKEGRIYHRDPAKCAEQGDCFSPATGEKLRPGTPADAERFKTEPWPKRLLESFKAEEAEAAAETPAPPKPQEVRLVWAIPQKTFGTWRIGLSTEWFPEFCPPRGHVDFHRLDVGVGVTMWAKDLKGVEKTFPIPPGPDILEIKDGRDDFIPHCLSFKADRPIEMIVSISRRS